MKLVKIGRYAINLDNLAYIEDEWNALGPANPNAKLTLHFGGKTVAQLEKADRVAFLKYIAGLPDTIYAVGG